MYDLLQMTFEWRIWILQVLLVLRINKVFPCQAGCKYVLQNEENGAFEIATFSLLLNKRSIRCIRYWQDLYTFPY